MKPEDLRFGDVLLTFYDEPVVYLGFNDQGMAKPWPYAMLHLTGDNETENFNEREISLMKMHEDGVRA